MFALVFKWISVLILVVIAFIFYIDEVPPYYTFTEYDKWFCIFVLGGLASLQSALLVCKVHECYICRVWSDFILQLTGLVLIFLSCIFGLMYPPFSWAMGVFPIIGVLYLVTGRIFSQRSRVQIMREYNGSNTTI